MGMREDIRIPLTMLSLSFLNELPFLGSYKGKRFKFEKVLLKPNADKFDYDSAKLVVYLWKDLFSFENTDKKDMIIKEYKYNKEAIDEALTFIEETDVVWYLELLARLVQEKLYVLNI